MLPSGNLEMKRGRDLARGRGGDLATWRGSEGATGRLKRLKRTLMEFQFHFSL